MDDLAGLVDGPIADEQDLGIGVDVHRPFELFLAKRRARDDFQRIFAGLDVGHVELDGGRAGAIGTALEYVVVLARLVAQPNDDLAARQLDSVRNLAHAIYRSRKRRRPTYVELLATAQRGLVRLASMTLASGISLLRPANVTRRRRLVGRRRRRELDTVTDQRFRIAQLHAGVGNALTGGVEQFNQERAGQAPRFLRQCNRNVKVQVLDDGGHLRLECGAAASLGGCHQIAAAHPTASSTAIMPSRPRRVPIAFGFWPSMAYLLM